MERRLQKNSARRGQMKDMMQRTMQRAGATIAALGVITIGALIAGCGGGGDSPGVSPQVVSGVAATGAPMAGGQVFLKDASSIQKQTTIDDVGVFSIDVTGMKAPFVLKATQTVGGFTRTMFSFADKPGTANVNPLSSVALANAAGVDDPATVFDNSDTATLDKVSAAMPDSIGKLRSQIMPLLADFSVSSSVDPLKDDIKANHEGLDAVFDNVKIVLSGGTLTITNVNTGAVLFTADVKKSFDDGDFNDNSEDLPKHDVTPPAAPTVTAVGGDGQVTISWTAVASATSYDLFYATKSNVAERDDHGSAERDDHDGVDAKRVRNVTSPFVLMPLDASTQYYFTVRAVTNGRRGDASAEKSATTTATIPALAVPAAPTGVTATGGTKHVTISWAATSGAASFNSYWSTTTGVTIANGTKVSGVTSPTVQNKLTASTAYFFVVTAVNKTGESAASAQVTASTLAPGSTTTTTTAAGTSSTAAGTSTTAAGTTTTAGGGTTSTAAATTTTITATTSTTATTASTTTTTLAINGVALYATNCEGCHGALASSEKRGRTAPQITSAIAANRGGMGSISLTPAQVTAIAAALL
jgi:mono/diheme cytochrome c family protein